MIFVKTLSEKTFLNAHNIIKLYIYILLVIIMEVVRNPYEILTLTRTLGFVFIFARRVDGIGRRTRLNIDRNVSCP